MSDEWLVGWLVVVIVISYLEGLYCKVEIAAVLITKLGLEAGGEGQKLNQSDLHRTKAFRTWLSQRGNPGAFPIRANG